MDTETISAFRFRLYWLAAKMTSCIWVAIPVDCIILHWYACGVDRRADGRTVTWLPKFLGWVDYHSLLRLGLGSRALLARVELRYNPLSPNIHIQIICTDLITLS